MVLSFSGAQIDKLLDYIVNQLVHLVKGYGTMHP